MRRYAAIAARFLLFHFLSVLVTATFMAVTIEIVIRYKGDPIPVLWPAIRTGFDMTLLYGPHLLVPSALGWWISGIFLAHRDTNPARRPVFQGVMAGFFTIIAFGWDIGPMPPSLIGLPVGAPFGWLIYRKLWPDPPGTSPDQAALRPLR